MKKERNYLMIIIVLGLAVIILLVALILLMSSKNKENNSSITEKEVGKKIECMKDDEDIDEYKSIQKYIIEVAKTGELEKYTNQYIYTYKNRETYNALKESNFDGAEVVFNDASLQMTRSYVTDKMINNDGEKIEIWYKNFQISLESQGYLCEEK